MRRGSAGFAMVLLLLPGCTDALIYGERTSFNLAISVNDDAAVPLSVNFGLQRTVVSFAPPLDGEVTDQGRTVASGESVAAISRFDLGYAQAAGTPFASRLTIRTQFASGQAAAIATENSTTAARAVQLITKGTFLAHSPTKDALDGFLGHPRDTARQARLLTCMDTVPRLRILTIPDLLSDTASEAERQEMIRCLKLDNSGRS